MIRACRKTDLDRLTAIWLEASIQAHHFIPTSYWEANKEDVCNHYIPMSETYVWVDEDTEEIYGFISLLADNLAAIFIDPSQQRRQIGKALVQMAKEKRNFLKLTVYTENKEAIMFYERLDFVIRQEQLDEATGHSEYVMVWQK